MLLRLNNLLGYTFTAAEIAGGVLMCVLALVSIALIVVTVMQKSNQDDVSAITGGSSSDTYYNKNKEMTKEKKLKIATIVLACVLVVSAIAFFLFSTTGTRA